MLIKGFECSNEEKVGRAILGTLKSNGEMKGGVGENASDEAKLAEYDRLGGAIWRIAPGSEGKKKYKVKPGTFYDFKGRSPVMKTVEEEVEETDDKGKKLTKKVKKQVIGAEKVIYIFRDISGNIVEVPEGESLPIEVQAAEIAKDRAEKEGEEKSERTETTMLSEGKKKRKKGIEDEE